MILLTRELEQYLRSFEFDKILKNCANPDLLPVLSSEKVLLLRGESLEECLGVIQGRILDAIPSSPLSNLLVEISIVNNESTVSTWLKYVLNKGYLAHKREVKSYVLENCVPKLENNELLNNLFNGMNRVFIVDHIIEIIEAGALITTSEQQISRGMMLALHSLIELLQQGFLPVDFADNIRENQGMTCIYF